MTSKKKLGSKLANGVRQVKLQREQTPAVPTKTVAATRPVAPRPASKTEVNSLHPQRIWPD